MNKVIIIGSGFTKAIDRKAPLGSQLLSYIENMYDKFNFESYDISHNLLLENLNLGRRASSEFKETYKKIPNLLYSNINPGFDEKKGSQIEDLELLLTLFDLHNEINKRQRINFYSAYENAFITFINWGLFNFLSTEYIKDQNGIIDDFCKNFIKENDTIITFNYDLLLDVALYKNELWSPISQNKGNLISSYWNNYIHLNDKKVSEQFEYFVRENKIKYLKLHGSINWFHYNNYPTLYNMDKSYREISKLFSPITGKCYFENGKIINPRRILSRSNSAEVFEELCLLRPALGKQYLRSPFNNLIRSATESMMNADEIFVIGYSLPVYDTIAEFLFSNINSNSNVTVINFGKETELIERRIRFGRKIGNGKTKLFDKGFVEWLYSI